MQMLPLTNEVLLCAMAGAVTVVSLLIWVVIARVRKKRYYASFDYINSCNKLYVFSAKLKKLLSAYKHIEADVMESLYNDATPAARFFDRRRYPLPQGVLDALDMFSRFYELMECHRREVNFALLFLQPYYALLESHCYISRSEMEVLVKAGESFVSSFNGGNFLFPETSTGIADFAAHEESRLAHNKRFVEAELASCREYFDTLANYPLDRQQRECCVVDDDAALVVAGAGSGKTSVIMAKVAYLVQKKKVDASSILLISFTNKSAKEMTERIAKCIGEGKLEAMTFHKFGLQLLKTKSDADYDIADDRFLKKFIRRCLTGQDDLVDEDYIRNVVDFFAYYFNPDQAGKEYQTLGERIRAERPLNSKTLKQMIYSAPNGRITFSGEHVKSLEETSIANYLFLNGIEYEYEPEYKKPYEKTAGFRSYHPDFYLPEYDIYIEHYGVDEKGEPPGYFTDIDKQRYKESMKWKRSLHGAHENKYIETFSWWMGQDQLFQKLEAELKRFQVKFKPKDVKEVWNKIREKAKGRITSFERLLESFISLFKSNGFKDDYFDELLKLKAKSAFDTGRQNRFLEIARNIFRRYQDELAQGNKYDFSDMIIKATEIVSGCSRTDIPYKYIIVDEYQDASMARMRLLKSVIEKTGAHLFCVGDDWQSIYRFAGSDINLFTGFSDYYGPSVMMKIENTYRNSQELINIMGQFVMKNPGQIRKTLKSTLRNPMPIVLAPYSKASKKGESAVSEAQMIEEILKQIAAKTSENTDKKTTVLFLGRTKFDKDVLSSVSMLLSRREDYYEVEGHAGIACQFLTVHKSKGLESDYVVLLNAKNDVLGFPNMIADDPVLQLLLAKAESYEYAEERRLFYVALTRTRNCVYLLFPEWAPSPFVEELKKLGVMDTVLARQQSAEEMIKCPRCKEGHLEVRSGRFGQFMVCSNAPKCDYKINGKYMVDIITCGTCGYFMTRRQNKRDGSYFWGCENYPYCKYTLPD